MGKGVFKIKNLHKFTREQALGQPISFQYYKDKEPTPLGVVTDVDEDYLYIDFEHNNDEYLTIEINNNVLELNELPKFS